MIPYEPLNCKMNEITARMKKILDLTLSLSFQLLQRNDILIRVYSAIYLSNVTIQYNVLANESMIILPSGDLGELKVSSDPLL